MRLPTFLLLIVSLAACVVTGGVVWKATAETREWNQLLSYSGRELNQADPGRVRVGPLIRKHFGPGGKWVHPWWMINLEGPGSSRRVVLLQYHSPRPIPSECPLPVLILDENRQQKPPAVIEAGWRADPVAVHPLVRPELGPWAFTLVTEEDRQHYVLIEDVPVLIRWEDLSGKLKVNNYHHPNWTVGTAPPVRSAEAWERALCSDEAAEILRTLVWLDGIHAPPARPTENIARESVEDTTLFAETCRRPRVRKRVSDLAASPNAWISEAAKGIIARKVMDR